MTIAVEHADAAPRFGGDKALRKRVMKWLNHHHHQPAEAEADAQPANTTAGAGHPRGSVDKQQSALSKTTSAANSAQSRKPQTGPISGPISVSATFTDAAVDLTQDQFSHDHDLLGNLGTMPEDEAGDAVGHLISTTIAAAVYHQLGAAYYEYQVAWYFCQLVCSRLGCLEKVRLP